MGTKDPRTVKSAKEQLDKKIGIKLSRSIAEKKSTKKAVTFFSSAITYHFSVFEDLFAPLFGGWMDICRLRSD